MKAVVTGSDGQDAQFLIPLLQHHGYGVIAIGRSLTTTSFPRAAVWMRERPEYVFHLAATSSTEHDAASENHDTIGGGTLNILEAAWNHSKETKIFVAGSGLQFVNRSLPIRETDEFSHASHYACARNYSTLLCRYYRDKGLRIWNGFLFNHESPYRKARHMSQRIARAAALKTEIQVGSLAVEKEWTFAADTVEAIWSLVNQDEIFEANIATGIPKSIGEYADACFAAVGLSAREFVSEKKGFVPEYRSLFGEPSRILSTGWRPKVDFTDLASIMVAMNRPEPSNHN